MTRALPLIYCILKEKSTIKEQRLKKICLNCEEIGKYKVPRELVETQLGWKLDMPYFEGQKVWIQYKLPDVFLCKECLIGIITAERQA